MIMEQKMFCICLMPKKNCYQTYLCFQLKFRIAIEKKYIINFLNNLLKVFQF